jgi:hypothetical protein
VHVFSFSTDDTSLFPSISAPDPSVIRTQTDLQGWAIEALSPTTTQITLVDQSDPKGWANKSWTPQQMVNYVAGVGDFAIKNGGPPVLTRLLGAKATSSAYDHDKGTLTLEYQAASAVPASLATQTDEDSLPAFVPRDRPATIECEIRCDLNVWASNLDIVIDPPPAKVSCLSRHRLSSGGGCWVTIEHESAAVGDERLLVLVRRGPASKEKGTVIINGSKAQVDVEELAEDKVKLLSQRKRVKTAVVPLDQYAARGPRENGRPSNSRRSSQDVSTTHSRAPSVTSQARVPAAVPVAPAPPLPPISYALEALAWLQGFHAEQGADPSVPAIGWTPVSVKNGNLRKKIVNDISPVYPVYRTDKVVEGLTAEQLVSVVTSLGTRPFWDDKIDSVTHLKSYGQGCFTSTIATRGSYFTIRSRLFNVASVFAYFHVPSLSATSSTSTVYLYASASYPSDDSFDAQKLNPANLPVGRILFEGWILETLDPYTSDEFAIPSTRCSYLSAIDYGGSVPHAVNSMLNSSLPRTLDALEKYVKTRGSVPRIQSPSPGLVIDGPLSSDGSDDCVWKLSSSASDAVVLLSDLDSTQNQYRILLSICKPAPSPDSPASQPDRPPSLTSSPSSSTLRQPASSRELRIKASLGSLPRPSTSPTTPSAPARDLTLSEVVVDLYNYPRGYDIRCSAAFTDMSLHDPSSLDSPAGLAQGTLPVQISVHEMPLPPAVAASLSASKPPRHLVRLTLPTSQIINPLRDPLTEGEPKKPSWYQRLLSEGALVKIIITHPKDSTSTVTPDGSDFRGVTFNGGNVQVKSERDSRALFERLEEEEWSSEGIKISR